MANRRTGKYLICGTCSEPYYVINSLIDIRKYCSIKCSPGKPKRGVNLNCRQCGESFYISQTFIKTAKYCSIPCQVEGMKKRVIQTCETCNQDYEVRISQIKHRGSKYCSIKCTNIAASKRTGERSPAWKGGKSNYNRIRKGIKWKTWRESVFKRDNYTCQKCGARSSKGNPIELHPHHIKEYAKYTKSRFVIKNGLTVCKACHYKIHTKKDEITHQELL